LIIAFDTPIGRDWIARQPQTKEGYRTIVKETMNRIGGLKAIVEK
jgi:hypothetical protein